jgi:26S proteasome regulatory subunit N1
MAPLVVLDSHHYLLYFIVPAMRPRFLITLDEDLKPLPVSVRVGQAVDVVGQAGRPKTITGWQTHNTPVLLSYGERAELEDDEYIALSHTLEGLVVLKVLNIPSINNCLAQSRANILPEKSGMAR